MQTELTFFSDKKLKALIVPLMFDQLLNVLVGMADTVMVSSVGEAAVSGVSLVDTLNLFFFMIFAGLATGGAILCTHMIGVRKYQEARETGNQLLLASAAAAILFLIFGLWFKNGLLIGIFGNVEADVMDNAQKYFTWIALSLPFLAVHNSCSALFRAMGDSKTPMKISVVMNVINVAGNAFCLFVLHMGVLGVAVPTFASKLIAAVFNIILISRRDLPISMRHFTFRFHGRTMIRILKLAVPSSLENSIFQVGKILVLGLVSSLGTVVIAANAVANSILTFQTLTEDAMSLAIMTVVGQCVGASEWEQALGYTKKMMKYTYLFMWLVNIPVFLGAGRLAELYHLSESAASVTVPLIRYNCICALTIWPLAFTLPNAIRAAGSVVYTMGISLFSMWVFRIGLSCLLVKGMGYGIWAIYISFGVDWVFRAAAFTWRGYAKRLGRPQQ